MTHTEPQLITVPASDVLAVDGEGPASSAAFADAVRALFAVRAALGGGDVPLQGTYAQAGGDFDLDDPDGWRWTLAVPAPAAVTGPALAAAAARARADGVRLESRPDVTVVRTEYTGPYDSEGPSLQALREAAAGRGVKIAGAHTETYLTDPASTPPEQLRTLLEYPVEQP